MAKINARTELRCVNGHPLYRTRGDVDDAHTMSPANLDRLHPNVRFAPGIILPICPVCNAPLMQNSASQGTTLRSDALKV